MVNIFSIKTDLCKNRKAYFPIASICLIVLLTVSFKLIYFSQITVPPFDSWRHLVLIRNIQTGNGFTLFNNQPYLWYSPIWYYFAAFFTLFFNIKLLIIAISAICSVLFFFFVYKTEKSLSVAFTAGILFAVYPPNAVYTSSFGSEPFSLLLIFTALMLLLYKPDNYLFVCLSGLIFGISLSCRINFIFLFFLVIPLINKKKLIIFVSAISLLFFLSCLRNYLIIHSYSYLFSWDGLATKTDSYNIISTFIPQLNKTVEVAISELHKSIFKYPEWFINERKIQFGTISFILLSLVSVVYTKRIYFYFAGILPFIYFTFFDNTLSGYFFRIYLPLFPIYFISIALSVNKLFNRSTNKKFFIFAVSLMVFASGCPYLFPRDITVLKNLTPPDQFINKKYYMVNSGYFHPENLIYKYPDKKFIGMPLNYSDFDNFTKNFPKYKNILWHIEFSIQDNLLIWLIQSKKYKVIKYETNNAGLEYVLLEPYTATQK